jgi:small-conductance mechanosensitive channel
MFSLVAVADPAGSNGTTESFAETSVKSLTDTFVEAYNHAISYAPKLLVVVLVLVIGYVVSRLAARVAATIAEKIGLQQAAERGGLTESMRHVGILRSVPSILGRFVFWILMFLFVIACLNILQWHSFSTAMQGVFNYVPNLVRAATVVVVGLLVASLLRGMIAAGADRVGISYAQHLASGCYWALVLMTFMAAFAQLEIKFELLNYVVLIVFAALGIAFGLAVGLGGRDVVAGILAGYYVRQRVQAGDHVVVGSLEGRVREVGPVATIVETDEGGLMNRRSIPNIKMLNEAVR